MKEHPIMFNADMVRAILEGRKTQTRRVIKPQPRRIDNAFDGTWEWKEKGHYYDDLTLVGEALRPNCPYGQVGDRLWVKETFHLCPFQGDEGLPVYKAGLSLKDIEELESSDDFDRWRSSRFMPRWASRITLEITGVRVQRVQEITWQDCEPEGVIVKCKHAIDFDSGMRMPESNYHQWLRVGFMELWDSLNAKRGYGWDTNCWIWVIEFRRL